MSASRLKPKSTIPQLTGYLGLITIVSLTVLFVANIISIPNLTPLASAIIFLLIVFAVMALYELLILKSYNKASAGLFFSKEICWREKLSDGFLLKMLGLFVTLSIVTIYYSVADLYRGSFYDPFFAAIFTYAPYIGLFLISYFVIIHVYMKDAKDAYWHLGRFVMTLGKDGDRGLLKAHLLALAVKTFFLPLMFCSFMYDWGRLTDINFWINAKSFYRLAYEYLMFIDLIFTIIGYVFASRLLNSHIRWTEDTAGGWIFCLVGYVPFWQLFGRDFLNYHDSGQLWFSLSDLNAFSTVWVILMLSLTVIYVLSTVHFGLRFSNLTYRGIITDGTYRWTKHPAYISKNISWWLISVPFLSVDWTSALRNCLALLGVNYIYYRRAQYEERCLSKDPEYLNYMAYIEDNGIISRLKSWFSSRFQRNPKKVQKK